MVEMLTTKIRKIGTSVGVIIPQENITGANLQIGQEVEIALLPHKKDVSGFGFAKKFKVPFQRDQKAREFT